MSANSTLTTGILTKLRANLEDFRMLVEVNRDSYSCLPVTQSSDGKAVGGCLALRGSFVEL